MEKAEKTSNWRSAKYGKITAQLHKWISEKTRVVIGFNNGMFGGHLTGQLSEVDKPFPAGFQVASGNDLILFYPFVCESLSIDDEEEFVVITMECGESQARISPFVNMEEILKELPVVGRRVN